MSQNNSSYGSVSSLVSERNSGSTDKNNYTTAAVASLTELWKRVQCLFSQLIVSLEGRIETCIAGLEKRITTLEEQLSATKSDSAATVNNLSQSMDDMRSEGSRCTEHYRRLENSHDLMIFGIPFRQDEDLDEVFSKIAVGLGVAVGKLPVVRMQRISRMPATVGSSPPILCQFAFRRSRDEFFRIYLRHRSLSLHQIGFNVKKRVYINESLDLQTRNVLRVAIKLRRDGRLHKVWTRKGAVFVILDGEGEAKVVNNIDQLTSIVHTNLST